MPTATLATDTDMGRNRRHLRWLREAWDAHLEGRAPFDPLRRCGDDAGAPAAAEFALRLLLRPRRGGGGGE